MTPFEETLKNIDDFCTKHNIQYSIIGGLALIAYKIQRTTNDIDITLLLDLEKMGTVGKQIIDHFKPLFENPIQFFEKNFVLPVVDKATNIRIDFAAGLTGFDKKVVERSKRREFGNLFLPFCTLEDLILYKLFATRARDIADLQELARVYKKQLNRTYINTLLDEFAKLDREDMKENFNKIFN